MSSCSHRSSYNGLSPRVRGNRCTGGPGDCLPRSIPACAGEPVAVHVVGRFVGGLSPRVRGNQPEVPIVYDGRRSIPACAGEPSRPSPCVTLTRVYPRVCGGTSQAQHVHAHPRGLSPRVRGNRLPRLRFTFQKRSIPACAGEPL